MLEVYLLNRKLSRVKFGSMMKILIAQVFFTLCISTGAKIIAMMMITMMVIIIIIKYNIGAVIYGTKLYARVHSGPLSRSRSTPGSRQIVGQAANCFFVSACHVAIAIRIIVQPYD